MSCCNPEAYNRTFGPARAQQDLQDYLQSGLKKSSQPFMRVLEQLPLAGKSLLDIGGGVGAVTLELFKRQIRSATLIDLSQASVELFRAEVEGRGLSDRVQSRYGDFVDVAAAVPPADLVILDKVLCCYADFAELVHQSSQKARQWYVYSLPRDTWWSRLYFFFETLPNRIRGKHLSLYFHANADVERILVAAGLAKQSETRAGYWRIVVFRKNDL